MNTIQRQLLSIILAIFLGATIIYGSILPILKAQKYIEARKTPITSLEGFDEIYGGVLSFPSPVGQDELVSNYLEIISNIVGQEKGKEKPNESVVRTLVGDAEQWTNPIIARGTGFSFSQILFNFANVYRDAALILKDKSYYQKAVEMYNLGLKYSPDREIFLYSLFDLYRIGGDNEDAKKIGARIMEVYKDDKVQQILSAL